MKNKAVFIGVIIGFIISLAKIVYTLSRYVDKGFPDNMPSLIFFLCLQTIIYMSIGGVLAFSIQNKKVFISSIVTGAILGMFLMIPAFIALNLLNDSFCPHEEVRIEFQSFCYNAPDGPSKGGFLCKNGIAYYRDGSSCISGIFLFPIGMERTSGGNWGLFYILPIYGIIWGALIGASINPIITKIKKK